MDRSITITYVDPNTGKQLSRRISYGRGETKSEMIIFILRSLNFVYEQDIKPKFQFNDEAGD